MTSAAIQLDGVGKQYRIGVQDAGGMYQYKSLRDSVGGFARRPWGVITDRSKLTDDNSFWALKDVSFEVKQGEVVGIIGRNGAGKSTLLKILSQITKPTTGEIAIRGRVGSLLEVGTGFHPELSGRENIYLNGAILGMTRGEVKSKFDEIVAFSEVERFLDTPVKQYSSGMYTRLAFAVAAHLEPEILVVDEVLAVGDAAFQKKCLGKMKDVAGEGRTVLFVSHNMGAVRELCDRGVLLVEGSVAEVGAAPDVVRGYLDDAEESARAGHARHPAIREGYVHRGDHEPVFGVEFGEPVQLHLNVRLDVPADVHAVLTLRDSNGDRIASLCSREEGVEVVRIDREIDIDATVVPILLPGRYAIDLDFNRIGSHEPALRACSSAMFEVRERAIGGSSYCYNAGHGVARLMGDLSLNSVAERRSL